ncbi:MAG: hypothetical protein ACR2QK_16480 [Acidimicrobiales bacterium]
MTFATDTDPSPADVIAIDGSAPASEKRRRSRWLPAVAVLALVAAGCSSGPGTEEEFIEVLSRDGSLTTEEATCISDAVFAEYGDDSDALGTISAAPDFEYLSSEEGVEGFSEFFDATVQSCSTVGPTPGS